MLDKSAKEYLTVGTMQNYSCMNETFTQIRFQGQYSWDGMN